MALAAALQRFIDWFWGASFPIWAERGWDAKGGFFESLDNSGRPIVGAPRRVRVQARQVYVFTTAARLARHAGAGRVSDLGFDYFVVRACPEAGARGCLHALNPDGTVLDTRRDLYDQAFLILAAASRVRRSGDPRALGLARGAIDFIDRELKAPAGGYLEDDVGSKPRRQNPHMHLFEAMLALAEATGDDTFLGRARQLKRLFDMRFFDRRELVLREFFDDPMSAPDPRLGDIIEPGHMMEWVCLLDRYAALTGEPVADMQRVLYVRAQEIGRDSAGFLVDRLRLGSAPAGPRRLWPQTEYLRASLVTARLGLDGAGDAAARLIEALFASYLHQPVNGLWCDQYDGEGRSIAASVPASIVYHLMEAALEAEVHLKGVKV
jgi:mannose-6-phosphate isomerase